MGQLAEKLTAATGGQKTEPVEDLSVNFDEFSERKREIPVHEIFSWLFKGFVLWSFFQVYLYLNHSLPAVENFIDGKISTMNSAIREQVNSSDDLKKIIPIANDKSKISSETFRQIIRNPTMSPKELTESGEGMRRH